MTILMTLAVAPPRARIMDGAKLHVSQAGSYTSTVVTAFFSSLVPGRKHREHRAAHETVVPPPTPTPLLPNTHTHTYHTPNQRTHAHAHGSVGGHGPLRCGTPPYAGRMYNAARACGGGGGGRLANCGSRGPAAQNRPTATAACVRTTTRVYGAVEDFTRD